MSGWIWLACAIVLEVAGTLMLKLSDGFARWPWGVAAIGSYSLCFWVLAPALKLLPVGVVYAVWAGIGIVATAVLGWWLFGERLNAIQIGAIALILLGAVGLRLSSPA